MIRMRIKYIFSNFRKKHSIMDYIDEPRILTRDFNEKKPQYMARPVFNSIRVGENKEDMEAKTDYRIYKIKYKKTKKNSIGIK